MRATKIRGGKLVKKTCSRP